MNLEDYIKDLAPELQEKGRACGSVEELLALAMEAQIAVPDEVLEAIAGGADAEALDSCGKTKCPACGSTDVKYLGDTHVSIIVYEHFQCNACGHKFDVMAS